MKIKKLVVTLLIGTISLGGFSPFDFEAFAETYTNDANQEVETNLTPEGLTVAVVEYEDLPDYVKAKMELFESKNVDINNHIEQYAYKVDLNRYKVIPPRERNELRIPNDGFTYTFDGYDSSYINRDWSYSVVETVRYGNDRNYPISGNYTQQSTVTKTGYVEGNANGSAKVNALVSEVEVELGITAGYSRTWSKGSSYGVSFTIPANDEVFVTNYAVSVNSNGSWRYKKYTPGGFFVGYYYESAGGTVISKSDNNFQVY